MMSREQLASFRQMTVSERWKRQIDLLNSAWEEMERLSDEEFALRIRYLNRLHDEGNQRILDRFRSLENAASTSPHTP